MHRQLLTIGDCVERRDDYRSHSGHVGINAAITEGILQNVSLDVNSDHPRSKSLGRTELLCNV